MIKLSLKSILSKKNETAPILASLIERLNTGVWIEDDAGNILLGNRSEAYTVEQVIKVDNELIGFVKGNEEEANIIAAVLNHSIKKEAEKRKLGSEVLNLYQEINLIYNFSERLAQTIDATTIS